MPKLVAIVLLAASAAHADTLVATHDKDTLLVHRVAGDKLTKDTEEKGKGAYAYAWSDATTLWVLREVGKDVTVGKLGAKEPPKQLGLADWKMKAELDAPEGFATAPGILTTSKGQVWVTRCMKISDRTDHGKLLCDTGYVRVDDGSATFSKVRPKDVRFEFGVTAPLRPPVIKAAPAGFALKKVVTKVQGSSSFVGFACTGPKGQHFEWPEEAALARKGCKPAPPDTSDAHPDSCESLIDRALFTPQVTKLEWLSITPPIARAVAKGKSPVGEVLDTEIVVAECTGTIETLLPLHDGNVLTDDSVRKATGEVIGKLPGTDPVVAP